MIALYSKSHCIFINYKAVEPKLNVNFFIFYILRFSTISYACYCCCYDVMIYPLKVHQIDAFSFQMSKLSLWGAYAPGPSKGSEVHPP